MRIKKTSQTTPVQAEVVNDYSTSQENAYSCDYVNGALTYSTDEVNTHKKWIDGKDIYRKVYIGTSGAGGNWASFPLNITNLNEITDMRFKCGNPVEMYTSNFYVSTTYQIMFRLGVSEVQYLLGSGYSDLPYKVTVEYTKTTD